MNVLPGTVTKAMSALLAGGPDSLPAELRRCAAPESDDRIKVEHWGGYEHFQRRSVQNPDDGFVIFDWVTRTRIAE
ncbi:DUF5988 family protein [Actinoplanes subglobosus]|uniref:DUF5988 family protein n=1 Tax=Actinoplanes subglobosus TaxID=1547892 RepID=A0ABV8IYN2_9ACTN